MNVLTLSSSIYPLECLHDAITGFQGLCSVTVISATATEYSIEIRPSSNAPDRKQLINEFLNYLLDLSLEKHLTEFQKSYGTDTVSAP